MKYLLSVYLLLTAAGIFGQECDQAGLQKKTGTWKAGPQGSIRNVSAADLVKEKAVMVGIHKMVGSHYSPMGCQISYSYVFDKSDPGTRIWMADPYHYAMYILRFLCDKNAAGKSNYYVDYSTPTTVNISANAMYWVNTLYAANLEADDFRGYLKLKKRPEKKDGFYFMGDEVVGDGNQDNKIIEYRWLITYNDTLPFSYVSRKEYLLIQKKRLEQTIKENPGEKQYNEKFLNNISAYLKRPETELDQPAVCMWNEEEHFEKFADEGASGSFIAIKPNLAYYRKKLPMSSPQFFTVVYKISHGDPVFESNISAIKKAVDFAALKNMLGK